jgi:hypothetical protein
MVDFATSSSPVPTKLKKGSKLIAVKQFFDIPDVRNVGTTLTCNMCGKKLKLASTSIYNLEMHCARFHIEEWNHVLDGGKPIQTGSSDLVCPYTDKNFREALWQWVDDEQSHLVL